ncbi:unnamed protein product [Microthlaspi erraticum]|uniref:Uncharacterized protein n=1 Tax=Microthlaspi erraticum TaxID=1685480 RepID=A0A6D2L9S5_9BRAS|nr:unnamed protein product [Microthlaspi erraticum]
MYVDQKPMTIVIISRRELFLTLATAENKQLHSRGWRCIAVPPHRFGMTTGLLWVNLSIWSALVDASTWGYQLARRWKESSLLTTPSTPSGHFKRDRRGY